MKKVSSIKILFAVSIVISLTSSCTKENPDVQEFKGLSLDTELVLNNVPEGLKSSSDSYAQQCFSGIQSALDMSSFISDMTPPEDAQKSNKKGSGETWQWTTSDGMQSLTFYWKYEEDVSKNYWTMDIQIDGGEKYSYVYAWESKDGKQGQVQYNFNWVAVYDNVTDYEDLFWTYNWVLDNDGNYTFAMSYDSDGEEYNFFLKYDIVVNADGSGTIDYYTLDEYFYHMEWDAMGNGSWKYYPDGENSMSGMWTV